MNANDKFCLKWNDFQENIKTTFVELRGDKDLVDVTLACEDGEIEAHKVILSFCSPFFKRLKTRQLTTMVDFIYLGEANIPQEDLDGFLLLAQELEVKGLAEEDAGIEDIERSKNEITPGREFDKEVENENDSRRNIGSSQNTTSHDDYQNLCTKEDETLVPTETNLRQKVHIANDVLQMRETMFEKVDNFWTCKVCQFDSNNVNNLREHVEKHIEGVEYPCNLCGKIMRSSKSLRNHHSMKRCRSAKSNH